MAVLFLKVFSELLTTILGTLGTLKDFSKDHESKKWKHALICAIIVSGSVAMITQAVDQMETQKTVKETTSKLEDITNEARQNNAETSKLDSDFETNASASFEQQSALYSNQQDVLTRQMAELENTDQIINPLQKLGFYLTLSLDPTKEPCISKYVTRLRSELSPFGPDHLKEAMERFGLKTFTWNKEENQPDLISFGERSDFPHGAAPGEFTPIGLKVLVRFHRPKSKMEFGSDLHPKGGLGSVVEYALDFGPKLDANSPKQEKSTDDNQLLWTDVRRDVTVTVTKDIQTFKRDVLVLGWEGVDVQKEAGAPSLRTIRDLVGTTMEVYVDPLFEGCPARPDIFEFGMKWGAGYAFESQTFDSSDFLFMPDRKSGGVFIHKTLTLRELGLTALPQIQANDDRPHAPSFVRSQVAKK